MKKIEHNVDKTETVCTFALPNREIEKGKRNKRLQRRFHETKKVSNYFEENIASLKNGCTFAAPIERKGHLKRSSLHIGLRNKECKKTLSIIFEVNS